MSTLPPRTPPRFVPTLTEVVQPGPITTKPEPAVVLPAPAVGTSVSAVRPSLPPSTPAVPPALQKSGVLPPAPLPTPVAAARAIPAATLPSLPPRAGSPALPPKTVAGSVPVMEPRKTPPIVQGAGGEGATARPVRTLADGFEEMMVHRVMQRVDVMLEQRLRDAIASVVQEQTRSVLPRLREEIESVVRHSVYEAVADELASGSQAAAPR